MKLTRESVVSVPADFTKKCDIMPKGRNAKHTLECMVAPMPGAAFMGALLGGFAAAMRLVNPDAPGDEWQRKMLARADPEKVAAAPEGAILEQSERPIKGRARRAGPARPRGAILEQSERPIKGGVINGKKLTVAIDKHLIPRYDKKPWKLPRSKGKKGTTVFEAYITAHVVDDGTGLTLVALPIGPGDSMAEFVLKTPHACDKMDTEVRRFPMDREFFAVAVLNAMDGAGHKCMVPCRNTDNATARAEFDRGVRADVSECKLENRVVGKIRDGDSREEIGQGFGARRQTVRALVGFAMNSNEADIAAYKMGRGIETGYRVLEGTGLRTRSANPAARYLCFAASIILYNQWAVLNALAGFHPVKGWTETMFTVLQLKAVAMAQIAIEPEPPPTGDG